MTYNPLHFDSIDLLGKRCDNCVGSARKECNMTLNAVAAVQEMNTDLLAQGKEVNIGDPNNLWPKHNIKSQGCAFTDEQIDGLIAEVCSNDVIRLYFRGVGNIGVSVEPKDDQPI